MGPTAAAVERQTLRRGNGPEPDTLDPQRARTDAAFNILRDLFEGLTTVGPDGEPRPAAAESWQVSEDGLEYTFQLREGLRWSNGDALVAADFVAGMRRLVDPATASPYAQVFDPVLNAAAIVRGEQPPASLGVSAPGRAHGRHPAAAPRAIPARPARAAGHLPRARTVARRARQRARAPRPAGVERRVRALRLGGGLAHRRRAQ